MAAPQAPFAKAKLFFTSSIAMGHCCVALMQDAVVVEELPRFPLPALY